MKAKAKSRATPKDDAARDRFDIGYREPMFRTHSPLVPDRAAMHCWKLRYLQSPDPMSVFKQYE